MAEKQNYLSGSFLVSNSTIQDPNFNNTVVLIIDHDETGAFGLIVNRPGEASLYEALDDLPESTRDVKLYQGGPVRPDALFILHSSADLAEEGDEVTSGVFMSSKRDLLDNLIENKSAFHVYNGYSGWGPGQLESELKMKTWVVIKARKDMVFHSKPDVVWREALADKGGLFAYFAQTVRDPYMN